MGEGVCEDRGGSSYDGGYLLTGQRYSHLANETLMAAVEAGAAKQLA